MSTERAPGLAVGVAGILAVLAAISWSWRAGAARSTRLEAPPPVWDHVREQFPMPPPPEEAGEPAATDTLASLVDANPFSSQRRQLPAAAAGEGEAPAPKGPVFVYKGRIQLGARQRAVVHDRTTGKTHFLEVGQDVAGYKVLDITEARVLLSAPDTQERVELPFFPESSP